MKIIVTVNILKTKFLSAAICTIAYFLHNSFTVPQPRPILLYILLVICHYEQVKYFYVFSLFIFFVFIILDLRQILDFRPFMNPAIGI